MLYVQYSLFIMISVSRALLMRITKVLGTCCET